MTCIVHIHSLYDIRLTTYTTSNYLPAAIRYGCKKHKPKSDDDEEEEAVTEAETVTEE